MVDQNNTEDLERGKFKEQTRSLKSTVMVNPRGAYGEFVQDASTEAATCIDYEHHEDKN